MDNENFVAAAAEAGGTGVVDHIADATLTQTAPAAETQRFESVTAEDLIAKAREQEKAKLYPQLERLKEEVASLKKEREAAEAAEAAKRAEAEADAKRRAEEEMSVRELLQQKEMEFAAQLEAEREERERAFALLERERQFQELQAYRAERIEAERDNIIPELLDLIDGGSPDEIETSIQNLKDRSARILDSAQQAMQSARRDMVGTRTTIPASGPLDTDSENRSFSPEDISKMSISDYQKYRERLLGTAAASRGRGLFG